MRRHRCGSPRSRPCSTEGVRSWKIRRGGESEHARTALQGRDVSGARARSRTSHALVLAPLSLRVMGKRSRLYHSG